MRQILAASLLFVAIASVGAEDRAAKIREDAATVTDAGYWIYNDLPKGFALAERTGKPMLVVFRCVP